MDLGRPEPRMRLIETTPARDPKAGTAPAPDTVAADTGAGAPAPPAADHCPPPRSFESLYQTEYAGIYAYVLRRLPTCSKGDVADVVSEVFATAWRRADRMPPPPRDRLWLYGVARRLLSRQRRGLGRRLRLLGRLQAQATVGTVGDADADSADAGPAVEQVRAALDRLRPPDREVLALVLWDRLSHAEAAAVLGCSANAVGIRLYRARIRLQKILDLSGSPDPATDRHRSTAPDPSTHPDPATDQEVRS